MFECQISERVVSCTTLPRSNYYNFYFFYHSFFFLFFFFCHHRRRYYFFRPARCQLVVLGALTALRLKRIDIMYIQEVYYIYKINSAPLPTSAIRPARSRPVGIIRAAAAATVPATLYGRNIFLGATFRMTFDPGFCAPLSRSLRRWPTTATLNQNNVELYVVPGSRYY